MRTFRDRDTESETESSTDVLVRGVRTWFGGAGEGAEALGGHAARPRAEGPAGLLLAERRLAEAEALVGAATAEQTGST